MKRNAWNIIALSAAALAAQGCRDQAAPTESNTLGTLAAELASAAQPGRYMVLFSAERVPADFADRVQGLGGAVEVSLDGIGAAVVTDLSDAAAAELTSSADIRAVEPDPVVSISENGAEAADVAAELADATASPTTAQFYPRQWNMRAVFADQAWAAGYLGSRDVKVAILDTGIDYLHPDLAGLVDLEHSTSFVPEDVMPARYADRLPFNDLFWHGTGAASVVASNATVVAGVNRYVTLLAVKVVDSTFHTSAGRLLSGIVYAADAGVDVINLSNGVQRDKSENPGTVAAFERAVNYAFRKGALLVTVPFNDAADLDHNGDIVRLPCEAANAVCVSATGPIASAGVNGPWQNVDAIAPYSAFGRSAISVAAPGGAGTTTGFQTVWLPCLTTPTGSTGPPACRNRQPVARGIGTSWAAPLVSGLAALLVTQLGHGNPALIRARILQSADDLGEPGTDPFYGKGRINVARALGVIN